MAQLKPGQEPLSVDDLSDEYWNKLHEAHLRGQRTDHVLANGGYFDGDLLTPTPWYGQAPSPKTASQVIGDLRKIRKVIESCCEETLDLFTDPIDPHEFVKHLNGEDSRAPLTLLDRLERAEWMYPSDSSRLARGDKALVISVNGRPLRYAFLEPIFLLLQIWKEAGIPIVIGGKWNQSAESPDRYRFTPMIEFVAYALLRVDPSLSTNENDVPTMEGDAKRRRTSIENACQVAWGCATQLRKMTNFENSAAVRKLFEIEA